jgi:hypothetical protein
MSHGPREPSLFVSNSRKKGQETLKTEKLKKIRFRFKKDSQIKVISQGTEEVHQAKELNFRSPQILFVPTKECRHSLFVSILITTSFHDHRFSERKQNIRQEDMQDWTN